MTTLMDLTQQKSSWSKATPRRPLIYVPTFEQQVFVEIFDREICLIAYLFLEKGIFAQLR